MYVLCTTFVVNKRIHYITQCPHISFDGTPLHENYYSAMRGIADPASIFANKKMNDKNFYTPVNFSTIQIQCERTYRSTGTVSWWQSCWRSYFDVVDRPVRQTRPRRHSWPRVEATIVSHSTECAKHSQPQINFKLLNYCWQKLSVSSKEYILRRALFSSANPFLHRPFSFLPD